jgi:hypothetical protein
MLEKLGSMLGCRPSLILSSPIARFFSVSHVHNSEVPEKRWTKSLLRYHNDAAFREKALAATKAWQLNNHDSYRQNLRVWNKVNYSDPAFRQKRISHTSKLYHEQYRNDPVHMQRVRLRSWILGHLDFMLALPWKTHRPQWYPTSTEHICHSCRVKRHGGSKLWWQSLGSDDQYDCNLCYVKDVDASMPEGYEGITRWKDMVARKEQLDGLGQSNKSEP